MEKVILFTRQEGLSITTIAILKVTLDKNRPEEKVMEELKRLVTMWTRDTKDGKACYNYAGGDLNIGDLAQYDKSFSKYLTSLAKKNRGYILNIQIEYCGEPESTQAFDTILITQKES
jgi:hypothetical protein